MDNPPARARLAVETPTCRQLSDGEGGAIPSRFFRMDCMHGDRLASSGIPVGREDRVAFRTGERSLAIVVLRGKVASQLGHQTE
jgi:hypothetical protein